MPVGTSRSCSGTSRNAPTAASVTTVFGVQLIDAAAINHEFALVAARQIEVTHQGIPRIVRSPITSVVASPYSPSTELPRRLFETGRCSH